MQPEPLPHPPKHSLPVRKTSPWMVAGLATLLIAFGGWGLSHWDSRAVLPASSADNLSQDMREARAHHFLTQTPFNVRYLADSEVDSRIAQLPISPEEKAQLAAHKGEMRLAELVVWDDVDPDGDVVNIHSAGYTETVTLQKTPQTLYFPVKDGIPVTITGMRDGGGGITLGFTGSGQPVSLPVLAEGQSLDIFLR